MLAAPLVTPMPLCAPRGQGLTSEFVTSSSPEGWMVNLPSVPDTGWPSFSQAMSGSGLPLATQGKRAWEPSVVDRSGRPVSITGGTVGTGRSTQGLGEGGAVAAPVPSAWPSVPSSTPTCRSHWQPGHRPLPMVWTAGGTLLKP